MGALALGQYAPPPPNSFQLFLDNKSVAQVLAGKSTQKSKELRYILKGAFRRLINTVQEGQMAFVGQDWTQWITRWHNKAADGAANLAMDRKSSFHWQGAEPKQPGDCVLAYADGGCRAQAGLGPGSAACVLVAYQPGQRAARLL